jgi:hypothetical protein
MGKPKRHHWWPMAQSRYWTDSDGYVTVTRADGSRFPSSPANIGIESELYTRFLEDDSKDTAVEEWFAETIDAPVTKIITHLLHPGNVTRKTFRGQPEKARTVKDLDFRINPYVDYVSIPHDVRNAITDYVSALLVRHPGYLAKLTALHLESTSSAKVAKGMALDNMLQMFEVYRRRISQAVFLFTKRVDSAEYLYADGGLIVAEPWRREYNIPFDIHAPLTPDLALQVLPVPLRTGNDLSTAAIFESTNQGVARQNRIILGGAKRFVFSRQQIPASFIMGNFGKPAPKNIGYSVTNGRLETFYDPNRT